jgi:hypothetical protein
MHPVLTWVKLAELSLESLQAEFEDYGDRLLGESSCSSRWIAGYLDMGSSSIYSHVNAASFFYSRLINGGFEAGSNQFRTSFNSISNGTCFEVERSQKFAHLT